MLFPSDVWGSFDKGKTIQAHDKPSAPIRKMGKIKTIDDMQTNNLIAEIKPVIPTYAREEDNSDTVKAIKNNKADIALRKKFKWFLPGIDDKYEGQEIVGVNYSKNLPKPTSEQLKGVSKDLQDVANKNAVEREAKTAANEIKRELVQMRNAEDADVREFDKRVNRFADKINAKRAQTKFNNDLKIADATTRYHDEQSSKRAKAKYDRIIAARDAPPEAPVAPEAQPQAPPKAQPKAPVAPEAQPQAPPKAQPKAPVAPVAQPQAPKAPEHKGKAEEEKTPTKGKAEEEKTQHKDKGKSPADPKVPEGQVFHRPESQQTPKTTARDHYAEFLHENNIDEPKMMKMLKDAGYLPDLRAGASARHAAIHRYYADEAKRYHESRASGSRASGSKPLN